MRGSSRPHKHDDIQLFACLCHTIFWPLACVDPNLIRTLTLTSPAVVCVIICLVPLPCRAVPCLALPCLALPCLALPCLALPCLALCYVVLCCVELCYAVLSCVGYLVEGVSKTNFTSMRIT